MKTSSYLSARAWLCDVLFPIIKPALLTRQEFVTKYLPKYAQEYRPPIGIRLNARGRPMMSSRGSINAQVTKRERVIDECFVAYLSDYKAAVDFDARCSAPQLAGIT